MDNKTLGQRLRILRNNKGYTQDYLSYLSGISKDTISNMEREVTKTINKKTAEYLAYYLDCSLEYLLYGCESDNPIEIKEPELLHIITRNLETFSEAFELMCKINETLDNKEKDIFIKFMKSLLDK